MFKFCSIHYPFQVSVTDLHHYIVSKLKNKNILCDVIIYGRHCLGFADLNGKIEATKKILTGSVPGAGVSKATQKLQKLLHKLGVPDACSVKWTTPKCTYII